MARIRLFNGLFECPCGERYELRDAREGDDLLCEVCGAELLPAEDEPDVETEGEEDN